MVAAVLGAASRATLDGPVGAGTEHTAVLRALLASLAPEREPGGRLHQLAHRGRGLAEMLRHLAGERVLWWQVPLLSVVWMTSSVAAQWVLFIALDVPVGFWTAAASVGLGVIATVLTQTPGGIGSTEAAMVAAYTAFGIDQVDALAGTLLFRGIHYALVLGFGAPSLLYCELSHSRASASRLRRRRRPSAKRLPTSVCTMLCTAKAATRARVIGDAFLSFVTTVARPLLTITMARLPTSCRRLSRSACARW